MKYFKLKNGERLCYEEIGSGSNVVVMMHGWSSSKKLFRKPSSLLAKDARCIFYDHRGHKGSKKANGEHVTMETLASDLRELLLGLSLTDVTLVGWSMGACTALNYVKMYGTDRLKNVVLCDMSPKLLNDDEWHLGLGKGTVTKESREKLNSRPFFDRYKDFVLAASHKMNDLPDFLVNLYVLKKLFVNDQKVLESLSVSMLDQDNRDALNYINVPLYLFYADPGTLFLPGLSDWYREHAISQYKAVKFPNSTHQLIHENPERFAKAVKKILEL